MPLWAASHERYFLQGVKNYTVPAGPLEQEDFRRIMLLSLILRIAKSLDLGQKWVVEGVKVEFDDHEVALRLRTRGKALRWRCRQPQPPCR